MAWGDTYTIIYLKMQLLSLKTDGVLTWTGLEENFADELALNLDEKPEDVEVTLSTLQGLGLGYFITEYKFRVFRCSEPRDRSSKEYKQWRKAIFERDNYTCTMCGERGGRLNAHHILSWIKYPEHRYNVNNGITLCESCHKEIHRGKKNGDR